MLLPYRLDIPCERLPWSNWLLLALMLLVHIFQGPWVDPLILRGWNPTGWVGSVFVHADWGHLIGNGLFLFLFGNALCSKLGSRWYLAFFFGCELISSWCHLLLDGRPAVGASGAVNGVIGGILVYFPRNRVSMMFFIFPVMRSFDAAVGWLIGFWMLMDLWGALSGGGHIAYLAHVGGLAGGVAFAAWLLKSGRVPSTHLEENVFDLLPGQQRGSASPAPAVAASASRSDDLLDDMVGRSVAPPPLRTAPATRNDDLWLAADAPATKAPTRRRQPSDDDLFLR